jgi:hypothetical protein
MQSAHLEEILSKETLDELFPGSKANDFFEALFGDPEEGAFDIRLHFAGGGEERLDLEFRLEERPNKCLSCSLTYGLPDVFARHPVIDLKGLVERIDRLLPGKRCVNWELGRTKELSAKEHAIPLRIDLEDE